MWGCQRSARQIAASRTSAADTWPPAINAASPVASYVSYSVKSSITSPGGPKCLVSDSDLRCSSHAMTVQPRHIVGKYVFEIDFTKEMSSGSRHAAALVALSGTESARSKCTLRLAWRSGRSRQSSYRLGSPAAARDVFVGSRKAGCDRDAWKATARRTAAPLTHRL